MGNSQRHPQQQPQQPPPQQQQQQQQQQQHSNPNVVSLMALGFGAAEAEAALAAHHNSVERAAETLFAAPGAGAPTSAPAPAPAPAPRAPAPAPQPSEGEQLARALAESRTQARSDALAAAERRRLMQEPPRAAAAPRRAGQHGGTVAAMAPAPARPRAAAPASREQRVRAAVSQLEDSPQALDVLAKMLAQLHHDPRSAKYRQVSLANANFATVVASANGALELLRALGFGPAQHTPGRGGSAGGASRGGGTTLLLPDELLDVALVCVAKELLEAAQRGSRRYLMAKEAAELELALGASTNDANAIARRHKEALRARLPPEPPHGQAGTTLVSVVTEGIEARRSAMAPAAAGTSSGDSLRRRFEADHTLAQVVRFIDSSEAVAGRTFADFQLVDHQMFPPRVLEREDAGKTLQSLGMWPAANLQLLQLGVDASTTAKPIYVED